MFIPYNENSKHLHWYEFKHWRPWQFLLSLSDAMGIHICVPFAQPQLGESLEDINSYDLLVSIVNNWAELKLLLECRIAAFRMFTDSRKHSYKAITNCKSKFKLWKSHHLGILYRGQLEAQLSPPWKWRKFSYGWHMAYGVWQNTTTNFKRKPLKS